MMIQFYATKIIKPFVCAFFIVWAYSSSLAQVPAVFYDSLKKEIILLNNTDSVGSILLDGGFKATLNHEKKRKKKTVYYRLAEYSNPIHIIEVPVVISNSNIVLHLEGTLQGDTVAKFSCILKKIDDRLIMETRLKHISISQISFHIKLFPNKSIYIDSPLLTDFISMKRDEKRNLIDIILRDGKILYISFSMRR